MRLAGHIPVQTCPDPRPSGPPSPCPRSPILLPTAERCYYRYRMWAFALFFFMSLTLKCSRTMHLTEEVGNRQFYTSLQTLLQLTTTSKIKKSKVRRKTQSLPFARIIATCTGRGSEEINTLHRLWKNRPAPYLLPFHYPVICSWPLSESRLWSGFFLYSTGWYNRVILELECVILLPGPCVYLWKATRSIL